MTAIRRVLCVARDSDHRAGALVERASALARSQQAERALKPEGYVTPIDA